MALPQATPRLYKIQHNPYYVHTGHAANGEQVMLGVSMPNLTLVRFGFEGNFIAVTSRAIPKHALSLHGSVFRADTSTLAESIDKWKDELGFVPGTISIQRFFLPELSIGIQDLPQELEAFLQHPGSVDEESRRDLEDDVRRWIEEGSFVLRWNEDYYVNPHGQVISS